MGFSNIKLLIYDCDGVLTDNRVLVDETGQESVLFHRGDGYGIRMLKELGIEQMIVSTETNPIVARRAEKLKISVAGTFVSILTNSLIRAGSNSGSTKSACR